MPRKKVFDKEPLVRAIEEIEMEMKKPIDNPWVVKGKYRAIGYLKDELFQACRNEMPQQKSLLRPAGEQG
ncbi:hypothetical protein AAU61_17055 [Desulfocarbo indianensis]|nr:hypothetical protein AAU61_17055 [Desulfocarbo indianensis]